MIAAQVPDNVYQLHLHSQWFRKDGKTFQNPELVKEMEDFRFKGSDMEFWGKALGIPLGNGVWLRVQFALHRHGLPATRSEYNSMVEAWETSNDPKTQTFVAATIVGSDITVILVDR